MTGRTSRAASSVGRAASSLSFATTTTAQPAGRSINTPVKPSAARYGGLAEKEFQKLQNSVRKATKAVNAGAAGGYKARHAQQETLKEQDEYDEDDVRADPAPEGSFIADETSFSRAPLNPRLPHISPHRVSAASSHPKQRRPSQFHEEDDDISDSGSLIEEEEEDEQTRLRKDRARRREKGLDKEPLQGLSAELQEALMVEDLLFVLMGIEGRYIEFDSSYSPEDEFERLQGASFVVDQGLDPWISSAVTRFLPLATYYTAITAFIEQYSVLEHGVINHALCAAIREMLRDYLVLLAHLEEQFTSSSSFTLQRFWLLVHPALNTLGLIHALTTDIVALSLPPLGDDTSSEDSDASDDDDDAYGGAMGGILAEMKAASAAARPAKASASDGWRAGPAKGGEVLQVIFSRLSLTSGDPATKQLYEHLLLAASQPYAAILIGWISSGKLDDPYDEFIVKETKGINQGSLDLDYTDDYWERRYTLRDRVNSSSSGPASSSAASGKAPARPGDDTPRARGLAGGAVLPAFLEPWKDKILLAGKYLNVIRECGIEIVPPAEAGGGGLGAGAGLRSGRGLGQKVSMNEESFYKRIDVAYTYANKTLLKLLLEEEHLVARLESIKQYFFINHGDVFTAFLDLAKHELGKKRRRIMLERLQTQLDLALRNPSSRADDDPYKDDLKIVFEDVTVAEWLLKVVGQTGMGLGPDGRPVEEYVAKEKKGEKDVKKADEQMGWDVFNLDYSVQFPLSLILSRKSITYYQMIFRHLLRLKHLERLFLETWTEHLKLPHWRRRSPYPELQAWKGRVIALRARMYEFVKQMYDFAVSEVLEKRWDELRRKIGKVETVDQLLKDHEDFLNTCTSECLLTNAQLLSLFHQKLFNTCYVFANYTRQFTDIVTEMEHKAGQGTEGWRSVEKGFREQWVFLERFEIHFDHHIDQALNHLNVHAARENSAILPLIVRLGGLRRKEVGKGGAAY
ncbi:hypothetical protein JCM11251_002792 [Rhodosporidiobolus azoricus]